jgi:AraC-like DNA-binding protein/mannose-6-phosphate isomerase-like protein (cupin superfamily)
MFGKSSEAEDYQRVPRAVAAMAKDFASGAQVAPHRHPRAQLVFAARGVMQVRAAGGVWLVPPDRALWIPGGVEHAIRCIGEVAMRTLYLATAATGGLPDRVAVLAAPPLLRELILEAVKLPVLYDDDTRAGRIMSLILDELRDRAVLPLHLPLPRDPGLARLCQAVTAAPAEHRTLAQWGAALGASSRTLARLFRRETGMSYGAWCRQARLLEALARLAEGQAVTTVALDLGYDSPSAFSAMFRRHFATTPSRYFPHRRGTAPATTPA